MITMYSLWNTLETMTLCLDKLNFILYNRGQSNALFLCSLQFLPLTAMDYDHLARTIQVEAAKGTMDEYCVAVSVLNRVRSPKFPNTVASVVYASRTV